MKIYLVFKDLHFIGIETTPEKAVSIAVASGPFFNNYEINFEGRDESLPVASYKPGEIQNVYARCNIEGATPYRVAQADGWFTAIFVIDRPIDHILEPIDKELESRAEYSHTIKTQYSSGKVDAYDDARSFIREAFKTGISTN